MCKASTPYPSGSEALVFRGPFVRTPKFGEVVLTSESALLVVDPSGRIAAAVDKGEDGYARAEALARTSRVRTLKPGEFVMPGLVDGHAHAPQHVFAGTGLDLPLLDWLMTYTFPEESKFKDVKHAERVYDAAVRRSLANGATTVSWFATIHLPASLTLVDVCERRGLRAHVGKVCMDVNSPDYYREASADESAERTRDFVELVLAKKPELVTPSIIPRFAPTCSRELLNKLGDISETFVLPVHTHLSENEAECRWVTELFPEARCYVDVYKASRLLNERSYFAHCCYCNDLERSLVHHAGAGVVHCPTSNFVVGRAICDVRQWLDDGVTVCLGTDVAGGYSTSVLQALRHAVIASRMLSASNGDPRTALSWREAFWLATVAGGQVLGLNVGRLEPGYQFDALVVDARHGGPFDVFDETPDSLLEKFIWNGDDRNVADVYVNARRVAGTRASNTSKHSVVAKLGAVAALAAFIAAVLQRR